jgi:hypothetical protein
MLDLAQVPSTALEKPPDGTAVAVVRLGCHRISDEPLVIDPMTSYNQ